jgi:predicted ribosomally synthesized peptide with nif11-like leader
MSRENAFSFLRRIGTDLALQKKLINRGNFGPEVLLEIAAEEGFVFNLDDWLTAVHAIYGETEELAEDALEQVAGGNFDLYNNSAVQKIVKVSNNWIK